MSKIRRGGRLEGAAPTSTAKFLDPGKRGALLSLFHNPCVYVLCSDTAMALRRVPSLSVGDGLHLDI